MVVVLIGGSVITGENRGFNVNNIQRYVNIVDKNSEEIDALVIGGGSIAREYISTGDELGLKNETLDELGIKVTHTNAHLFDYLVTLNTQVSKNIESVDENIDVIHILGGTKIGQTTDAVSLEVANKLDCKEVYMMSNIDGIYDTRNRNIKSASLLDTVDVSTIRDILDDIEDTPGQNTPIDKKALKYVDEYDIEILFCDGRNPENLDMAFKGDYGSKIIPD